MSLASRRIGDLVIRLQDCFLANPDLALSAWQAEQFCGADEMTCRAILSLLVEGGVVVRTGDGRFVRRLPAGARHDRRRATSGQTGIRPALAG
jgi:hypothetical protein